MVPNIIPKIHTQYCARKIEIGYDILPDIMAKIHDIVTKQQDIVPDFVYLMLDTPLLTCAITCFSKDTIPCPKDIRSGLIVNFTPC